MSVTHLIDVKTDNITDYKKTSLFLVFPYCSGKCGEECQNKHLRKLSAKEIYNDNIIQLYKNLSTHEAVVCGGLEPWDSFDELLTLVTDFAKATKDKKVDFVIYTGYDVLTEKKEEFQKLCNVWEENIDLSSISELIIKQGRYDISKKEPWFSYTLGVELATSNQSVIEINKFGHGIEKMV